MINFFKKYKATIYYFLSFVISSSLMITIFMVNKQNGRDFLIVRSDFFESVGFYKEFVRDLLNGNSIFFTYSSGLGINNIMSLSGGALCPLNILYLIFHKSSFDLITGVIIVIKVGLAALSFQVFSTLVLKNNNFFSVIISVFYSLSAFTIEYGTIQNAWLDAIVVLPVLCASIIECIEYNRRVNMILLYMYIFVTQYYMGYMIGFFTLFAVFLYVLLLYQRKTNHPVKESISKIINWLLGVVIAIMLSAFLWVPTLFFLAANRVPDSTKIVELNVSLLQILNSLFWGMSYGIEGTYAYIYCGIPVLILVPLFFINKKAGKKEKVFFGVLSAILLISMVSDRLNTFWHVFDQPDDFWYRYSYLLIFCLCSIASRQLALFEEIKGKIIVYVIMTLLIFYQLMLHTISLWELDGGYINSNFGFMINLILLILWGVIILLAFNKNKYKGFCFVVSCVIMFIEIASFSKRQITDLIDAESFYQWEKKVKVQVEEIKNNDSGLYRTIICNNNLGFNMDTDFGIYGIGDFGNQEKYAVRKFLSNVGFATSPRLVIEDGFNPVAEMILGIKYRVYAPKTYIAEDKREQSDSLISENSAIDSKEDLNNGVSGLIFKNIPSIEDEISDNSNESDKNDENTECTFISNPHALKMGYLVNGDIILYQYSGRNVFDNMNGMVSAMSGIDEDCFIAIPLEGATLDSNGINLAELDTGGFLFTKLEAEGKLDISIPADGYNKAFLQFEKEKPGLHESDFFVLNAQNSSVLAANRLRVSPAIEMEKTEDGKNFIVSVGAFDGFSPEYCNCDDINIYYLDEDALQKQYDELSKYQFDVSKFSNGYIEGTIHVEGEKRMLFTTIPYDPGWKVSINGIQTEAIRVIDGAFMAVLLPAEGDYNVIFKFECPGLKIGVIVSLCGLFALLSVIFEKKLKKKKER